MGSTFAQPAVTVDDEMGIARWRAAFYSVRTGSPVELDGTFVVRLGPEGTCTELKEWWHFRERYD